MSVERVQELWAKFLGGAPLSEEEGRALLLALESDSKLRERALKDHHLHGLLRARERTPRDVDAFERAFFRTLGAEQDGTRFIKKVESRIEEDRSEGQERSLEHSARPKAAEGPHRHSTRRSATSARGGERQPYLFPALLAAAVLLGIALLIGLSSGGPSRPDSGTLESARRKRATADEARKAALRREEALLQEAREKKAEKDLVMAEKARREAEERLAKILGAERKADQARQVAEASNQTELKEKAEADFLEVLRQRKEEEARLATLQNDEKRAEEAKRAVAKTPPEPDPKESSAVTKPAMATLERIEGEVYIVLGSDKTLAKGGEGLLPGQGLKMVGPKSRGVLIYPDMTRLELGSDSEVKDLQFEGGKKLSIVKGTITAKVAKQLAGEAMIFATPGGEAKVLGTTLRLYVDPDPKKGTSLDVEEGKVALKNLAGKTVFVESGHYAVAAVGVELMPRRGSSPAASGEALPELVITGLNVTNGKPYEWFTLWAGERVYIDRTFTYDTVAASVNGAMALRTANDDKFSTGDSFLSFHVNQRVTVYVAHDTRFPIKAAWMAPFVNSGEQLVLNELLPVNCRYQLLSREFEAGTVTLGGAVAQHQTMYTVVVVPKPRKR
jgi:hypothetical protein